MHIKLRSACLFFFVLFYIGLTVPVSAAEYIITPSVTARETYDDNVFFYEADDFEHLIAPALEIEARTERGKVQASLNGDIYEYQRHSELDTVDQSYWISADTFVTERLQLGVSGNYIRDYTFVGALEELGIIAERSIRTFTQIQPNATIKLDSRNTLKCFYRLNKTQYEFIYYYDNRYQDFDVIYIHDLKNRQTSLALQINCSQADYTIGDDNGRQEGWQFLSGADHSLSEAFKISLRAGARYSESDFPWDDVERYTTFVVNSGFEWKLERTSISVNVIRDFSSSLYGEDMTRDRINTALRYRIRENLNCALYAAFNHSETKGFYQKEKYDYYSIAPSINCKFNEYISMRLGYTYNGIENKITHFLEERNRIFLQVDAVYPGQY